MVFESVLNICNAKFFWQNIKKLGIMAGLTSNITKEVWHDYFYNVFITHFNVLTEIDGLYNIFKQYPLIHYDNKMLNGVSTEGGICISLKNLKKGKAAGPDGLVAEMFLSLSHIVVPYLLKLLN